MIMNWTDLHTTQHTTQHTTHNTQHTHTQFLFNTNTYYNQNIAYHVFQDITCTF
jgi:hypothetical protein